MEVWVLEWSYPSDGETSITLWSNQIDAQKQALKEIVDDISGNFDMDDSDATSCADDVDDLMNRGQLGEAIKRYNDYQDNYNADYASYYFVTKKQVLSFNGEPTKATVVSTFTATSSGATCRGPCGQFNEYAMADKADGTHVCRQCSTFHHIFGTKS